MRLKRHNEFDKRLSEDGWKQKFFMLPEEVYVLTPMTTFRYVAWFETLEYKDSVAGRDWRFPRTKGKNDDDCLF